MGCWLELRGLGCPKTRRLRKLRGLRGPPDHL